MAATVSPGVRWREIDLSNYVPQLSSTQMCIIGTATKGPTNQRTLITSMEQFVQVFGYYHPDHLATYSAAQYLKEGDKLWFVRVESEADPAETAKVTAKDIANSDVTLESLTPGSFYNDLRIRVTYGTPRRKVSSYSVTAANVTDADATIESDEKLLVKNTVRVYYPATNSSRPLYASDDGAGVLMSNAATPAAIGTVDYETGEVTLNFTAAPTLDQAVTIEAQYYSTFGVSITKIRGQKEYSIESYASMVLEEQSQNYYGTQLKSSQTLKTPVLTKFLRAGVYTLAGGTDGISTINDSDYIGIDTGYQQTGMQLFKSSDQIDINAIAIPGQTSSAVVSALVELCEQRNDCIALIDTPKSLSPQVVVDWADGKNEYLDRVTIDSTYAAIYYPWMRVEDPYNKISVFVPPCGFVAAAFARTDRERNMWWAPAGIELGQIFGVTGTERILSRGDRDYLYEHRINPINDFATTGVLIWGQRTSMVYPSALDRINVRRIIMYIEKTITTMVMPFVFRPHTSTTWSAIVNKVQPYLNGLVQQGALYEGRIVINELINPATQIDQGILTANLFIKPTKSAEQITLNFIILDTGAKIDEYIGTQF